ncbi:hypothetical protein MMC13_005417 [Lambiella insularis]|nr:hypothetical protein [Lambiella insularis]
MSVIDRHEVQEAPFSDGDNLTLIVKSAHRYMQFQGSIVGRDLSLRICDSFHQDDDGLEEEEVSVQLRQQGRILDLHGLYAYISDLVTGAGGMSSWSENSDFRFHKIPAGENITLHIMAQGLAGMSSLMRLTFEDNFPLFLTCQAISTRVKELLDQQEQEGWPGKVRDLRQRNIDFAYSMLAPVMHITQDDISWEFDISRCFRNAIAYQKGATYQLHVLASLVAESLSQAWQPLLTIKERFNNVIALTMSTLERAENDGFLKESDNFAGWESKIFHRAENLPSYRNAIAVLHLRLKDNDDAREADDEGASEADDEG